MYITIKFNILKATKYLITLFLLLSTFVLSQTSPCPEGTDSSTLDHWTTIFEDGVPKLKNMRKWTRLNKNHPTISLKDLQQMELVTNRLEYMAKDLIRYINKHRDSNMEAVCKYVFVKHEKYLGDFLILTHSLYDIIHRTTE